MRFLAPSPRQLGGALLIDQRDQVPHVSSRAGGIGRQALELRLHRHIMKLRAEQPGNDIATSQLGGYQGGRLMRLGRRFLEANCISGLWFSKLEALVIAVSASLPRSSPVPHGPGPHPQPLHQRPSPRALVSLGNVFLPGVLFSSTLFPLASLRYFCVFGLRVECTATCIC